MQPEFLSKTDQGMQGKKAVRQAAGTEVPRVEENYDIFARLRTRGLLDVVAYESCEYRSKVKK
jgi:hypothetical protein